MGGRTDNAPGRKVLSHAILRSGAVACALFATYCSKLGSAAAG